MIKTEKNQLIQLLKRERKIILSGLLLGLVAFTFYYFFFYIAFYNSKAKIYVKNFNERGVVTSIDGGKTLVSESGYSNPLFNYYEILQSESISSRIYPIIKEKYPNDLKNLKVNSKEAFSEIYPKLINAVVEPSTDIMQINFSWVNKNNTQDVLDDIIREFKNENLLIKKAGESKTREFLDAQTIEISQKLERVREQIRDYKLSTGIANIDVTTTNLINTRMDLEKQADLLASQIRYNATKLKEFSNELDIKNAETALRATGFGTDPYIIKVSQDLSAAKQNYSKLKAKFKDKYPDAIAAKNEIDELQKIIDERKNETIADINVPRAIYDGSSSQVATGMALTQAETASLRAQLRTVRSNINKLRAQESNLPEAQLGLDELKKLEQALSTAYQNIKEKQLEARIKENEILDNFIVLSSPSRATYLRTFILSRLLGFMMLGTLLGLGVAYVKEGIENKWADTDEMRAVTGQSVIGVIPWIKDYDGPRTQKIMDIAYTNIASEVISKAYLNQAHVISFIPTGSSKNKSIMANTVATKIAEIERNNILLIDLVPQNFEGIDLIDVIKLINKEMHFNENKKPSLLLAGKLEQEDLTWEENEKYKQIQENITTALKRIIQDESKTSYLNRLRINKQEININDHISSKGFAFLLNFLRNHYEFIFINAPHGLVFLPEIQTLKKISDGNILISSLNTNKQELIDFVKNIEESGNNILGIIAREENSRLERYFNLLEQQEEVKNAAV